MIRKNILYANFCDWKFTLTKADGPYLWNEKNQQLIDFTSAWNVTNLGWNNPEVARAMVEQISNNSTTAMWMNDEIQAAYATELVKSLPPELDTVIRATGGTDANDKAMLVARHLTKRKKIIGFTDTYHGHSFGTISIGYRPEYIKSESPVVPEFIKMDFPQASGDLKSDKQILNQFAVNLENILKNEDVAAIVTEIGIITGWGSTFMAPAGYLSVIRKLTQKYGTLLILDEVGTGFSRCGKLFGLEIEGVVPDMVTLAKAMSNGAATMAAAVTKSSYGEAALSAAKTHSTLAWMSAGAAASLRSLEINKRDKVWENAAANGKFMLTAMKKELSDNPHVGLISGLGMEIGLHFVKDKKIKIPDDDLANAVINYAYKNGLHLIFGGDGNIQIMPPLTTPVEVLQKGLDILFESVKSVAK
jgi:4-aminobutyrate aminotransferase-like enzyme